MKDRQRQLLHRLIESYIDTAQPVGSSALAAEGDLSSATVRNELAELEREGYLAQPHTSAGRIPTERAYRDYFEALEAEILNAQARKDLALERINQRDHVKDFAKRLADVSTAAVFVAFGPDDVFHTGLSNLFGQPEFSQHDAVVNIGRIVDHLDEVIARTFDEVQDVTVRIGSENPFGQDCTAIVTRCRVNGRTHIVGIIGPMRMDYARNVGLMRYVLDSLR